jgi:hypothetical protein
MLSDIGLFPGQEILLMKLAEKKASRRSRFAKAPV